MATLEMKRAAGFVLMYVSLMMLPGCVYFAKHTAEGACADSLDSPIRNFCVVTPGVLWRGERPNRTDARWLLQHHVGTVVNLEVFLNDRAAFEGAAVQSDFTGTVDYFHLPDWEPVHMINWSLLDRHVAQLLAILNEAPKPIYVHCLDGIDRTNTLAAAYRVLVEGVRIEDAIAEMKGFQSPWLRFDAAYIRGLQGTRREQILHSVASWKSRLETTAKINCVSGRCTYSTARFNPQPQAAARQRFWLFDSPSELWRRTGDGSNQTSATWAPRPLPPTPAGRVHASFNLPVTVASRGMSNSTVSGFE